MTRQSSATIYRSTFFGPDSFSNESQIYRKGRQMTNLPFPDGLEDLPPNIPNTPPGSGFFLLGFAILSSTTIISSGGPESRGGGPIQSGGGGGGGPLRPEACAGAP